MIQNLRLIEIELFSNCNRTCLWCPNRFVNRRKENIELGEDILLSLLYELRVNEYQGAITFSRFNEPFSHVELFKQRLKRIKHILPRNKLITNTNGDFLCIEVLDNLLINELTIMDYDKKGVEVCAEQLESWGADIDEIAYPYIFAHRGDLQMLYFVDWLDNKAKITDRGGTLPEYSLIKRNCQCLEPSYFVGVNYDGTVSPCCNIRNDINTQKPFIIGDLYENSLTDILKSQKATTFRHNCEKGIYDKASPCYYCNHNGGRYTQGRNSIRYE